jgi:hypothetical protein
VRGDARSHGPGAQHGDFLDALHGRGSPWPQAAGRPSPG